MHPCRDGVPGGGIGSPSVLARVRLVFAVASALRFGFLRCRPLVGAEPWRTSASRVSERCPCGALSTRRAVPGTGALPGPVARTQRPRAAEAAVAGSPGTQVGSANGDIIGGLGVGDSSQGHGGQSERVSATCCEKALAVGSSPRAREREWPAVSAALFRCLLAGSPAVRDRENLC